MPKAASKKRNSVSAGRSLHLTIDNADARAFGKANAAFTKEVTSSRAKAVKALKASGYLTASGKLSKRYQ